MSQPSSYAAPLDIPELPDERIERVIRAAMSIGFEKVIADGYAPAMLIGLADDAPTVEVFARTDITGNTLPSLALATEKLYERGVGAVVVETFEAAPDGVTLVSGMRVIAVDQTYDLYVQIVHRFGHPADTQEPPANPTVESLTATYPAELETLTRLSLKKSLADKDIARTLSPTSEVRLTPGIRQVLGSAIGHMVGHYASGHQLGVELAMLTPDNQVTTRAIIAERFEDSYVRANVLAEQFEYGAVVRSVELAPLDIDQHDPDKPSLGVAARFYDRRSNIVADLLQPIDPTVPKATEAASVTDPADFTKGYPEQLVQSEALYPLK